MMCPHCHKTFKHGAEGSPEVIALIKKYDAQGYSCREIEKLIFKDGHVIGFSQINREIRRFREKKK